MINGGIIFKAGIFRLVGSWNQLIYIGSGQISFSQKQEHILIHYRISFLQWFLLTSVMSMLVWILTASLGTTVLAWMIIFLGNSGYAHYRFTRFLIKAASSKSAPSS